MHEFVIVSPLTHHYTRINISMISKIHVLLLLKRNSSTFCRRFLDILYCENKISVGQGNKNVSFVEMDGGSSMA